MYILNIKKLYYIILYYITILSLIEKFNSIIVMKKILKCKRIIFIGLKGFPASRPGERIIGPRGAPGVPGFSGIPGSPGIPGNIYNFLY